jgi:hypothetical protein
MNDTGYDDAVLRKALSDHLSAEPPMTTDLEVVLIAGRRARTRRQFVTAVAGCVGVVGVITAGFAVAGGDEGALPSPEPGVARSLSTSAAPEPAVVYPGPVPALIESRVRADMPGGRDLVRRTVYPGDWNRSTPLSVAQTANATDWHGRFAVPGKPDNELWISVFVNPPGGNPTEAELRTQCPASAHDAPGDHTPGCRVDKLGDGSLLLTQISGNGEGWWTRTLLHFRPGSRAVNARERVRAASYAEATRTWVYSAAQLAALAKDPQLVIPQPVHRPPLPRR